MDYRVAIFTFIGGLGFFLYGIKSMSEGLQAVAGDKMRVFLEKGTKTPLRGVFTGALVTALIQSSSGTTVLAVGLVNAGLMTLRQSIGVILGANIGTTITAYLIGFNLKDYALPIIGISVIMQFFIKSKKVNYIGKSMLGFGLLFYGMDVMGSGMKPLRESEFFINLMLNVESNTFLGVFVGTVFTAIVQSSSATIGILQELAYQGVITYQQAVPILFGDNIGTTITALLAGLGATVAARRAAFVHFMFNVIGTIIFIPLFLAGIFLPGVEFITNTLGNLFDGLVVWDNLNVKMQIAQTHGIFNISNTLIQLPFVALLAKFVAKIIPGEEDEEIYKPKYLEPRLLSNLPVALSNAKHETEKMGEISLKCFDYSMDYFFSKDIRMATKAKNTEDTLDSLESQITQYVLKATTQNPSSDEELSNKSYKILQIVGDLERIGDHSYNVIEATEYILNYNIDISESAINELKEMIERVRESIEKSLIVFDTGDKKLAYSVIENDDIIDEMEKNLRKSHIVRLNEGFCNGNANAIYLDILSNLERIGDHAVNIAEYTLESKRSQNE
jgi:phosphate:Na+ symporter